MGSKAWQVRVDDLRWQLAELGQEPWTVKGSGRGRNASGPGTKGKGKGKAAVTPKCVCCGANGHLKRECVHKAKFCHRCGKEGHLSSVCQSKGPPPDTAPKDRVPGAVFVGAKATRAQPWICGRCNTFVSDHPSACQLAGCKGRRRVEASVDAAPADVKAASVHPRLAARARCPGSGDDANTRDEQIQKAIAHIASCKDNGFDPSAAEDRLRELQKAVPKPQSEYTEALLAKEGSDRRFKVLKELEKDREANVTAAAKAVARATDRREKEVAAREAQIAKHEHCMAAIQEQYAALAVREGALELDLATKAAVKTEGLKQALTDCGEYPSQQDPFDVPACPAPVEPGPLTEAALSSALEAAKSNPALVGLDAKQLEAVAHAMSCYRTPTLTRKSPTEDDEMTPAHASQGDPPAAKKLKVED